MKFHLLPVLAVATFLSACGVTHDRHGGGSSSGSSAAPGSVEEFMSVVGDRVNFGFDKYNLTTEAQQILRRQAKWLKRYSSVKLTIEGHADERGTREYNLALGERRANSVKNFLAAEGVSLKRLKIISYGKERPVCEQQNAVCYARNRRANSVLR